MQTVIIFSKHQIVIPKEMRFVPVKDIKKMRGFLKGMDTAIKRDKDRI